MTRQTQLSEATSTNNVGLSIIDYVIGKYEKASATIDTVDKDGNGLTGIYKHVTNLTDGTEM